MPPTVNFAEVAAPAPPHAFVGSANVDGSPAPDGTLVTAWLEGVENPVAEAPVTGGRYIMKIVQRGDQLYFDRKINFRIGDRDAHETSIWRPGEADELNLWAGEGGPAAGNTPPPVGVPAGTIPIHPDGDTLKFDQARLEAKAGSTVTVVFQNTSTINQHNWVLVQDGTKDDVSAAGTAAGPGAAWVPLGDARVLAKTGLLDPGATEAVEFTVPAAGTYQFVCTFPGHNFTMFGDFIATP